MVRKLLSRPVIVLVVMYAALLVILDLRGYFSPARRSAVQALDGAAVAITGTVLEAPEKRSNGYAFTIAAESYQLSAFSAQPGSQRQATAVSSPDRSRLSEKILVRCYGDPPSLEPGDRAAVRGKLWLPQATKNPGVFDYAKYLNRQGIYAGITARYVKKYSANQLEAWRRWSYRVRRNIIAVVRQHVPETEAALLIPMLVGDKSYLTSEVSEAFTNSGLMHILVVSGMNVAYVAAIILLCLRLLGMPLGRAAMCTVPGIILYVLVTGASPPVVRAGVMAVFVIFALGLDREPLIGQSLALAALAILIVDPQALFTASFQLSFAATVGIVYLYGPFRSLFAPLPRWFAVTLGSVIAVTLAAQAAVLPLIVWYFHKISLVGFIANIAVVPFTGLITAGGMALYLFSFVSDTAAGWTGTLLGLGLGGMQAAVNYFAALPHGTLTTPAPSFAGITGCYGLMGAVVFALVSRAPARVKTAAWLAFVIVALLIAGHGYRGFCAGRELVVTFLDVGEGDAIHLRFPNGQNWLIDGGGSYGRDPHTGRNIVVPYLRSQGVKRLDRIVVTHPHLPHYGGIEEVLEVFPAGEIVRNPQPNDEEEYLRLLEKAKEKNIPVREAWAGEILAAGAAPVTVVSPDQWYLSEDDNSLALSIYYAGRQVVLTADTSVIPAMPGACALLQLPNHGNRGDAQKWLAAFRPELTVVSGRAPRGIRCVATVDGALRYYVGKTGVRMRRFGKDSVF